MRIFRNFVPNYYDTLMIWRFMVIQPGRPMDITSSDVNQQQVDGRHNGWSLICHQSSKLFFAMISQCRYIYLCIHKCNNIKIEPWIPRRKAIISQSWQINQTFPSWPASSTSTSSSGNTLTSSFSSGESTSYKKNSGKVADSKNSPYLCSHDYL